MQWVNMKTNSIIHHVSILPFSLEPKAIRYITFLALQCSSVQSLSCVRLFVTAWITACQASLSITNSRSSFKLMSIESVMPSSHENKRRLLLGRKAITNLDSIVKSRDITLPTKVHLAKAMVFPVVMYGCESCPVKKAERRIIDAFELSCWRRLLRVPWTASRSNQSILKRSVLGVLWKEWC